MTGTAALTACVFCDVQGESGPSDLVVYRGRTCFVILNLYPYNNGHLMIVPTVISDGSLMRPLTSSVN